jgi:SSS family solute:Na+ symporter
LDRVLNRGKYAVAGEHARAKDAVTSIWWKMVGITPEFTRGDRWLTFISVGWNFLWFGLFVAATVAHRLIQPIPDAFWTHFWLLWIWINLVISVPVVIWFSVGAARDIYRLFARLGTLERNERDMGMVLDDNRGT